ncbi:MAG: hypothetical protein ABSF99_10580 [Anaerolineales bacterium]|jgi:hypothetical protein
MPAPKGNTNALKHGLYAKQFNEDQRAGLRKMDWNDFRHEEFAHRAIGEAIFILLHDIITGFQPDIELVVKLVNSLAINTTATCTCARTHALLNGEEPESDDPLSIALDMVPAFLDERTD